MSLKEFIKTTEALIVLIGLLLTVLLGKFWAIATAIIYTLINVPSLIVTIRSWFNKDE